MSKTKIGLLLIVLCYTVSCNSSTTGTPDQIARDTIAGAKGFLQNEQTLHLAQCQAAPTTALCVDINKGIAAQHTLADALNVYCSGTPAAGVTPYATGGACVPLASYKDALTSAVSSLNQIISDIKAILGTSGKTAWMKNLDRMQAYLQEQQPQTEREGE